MSPGAVILEDGITEEALVPNEDVDGFMEEVGVSGLLPLIVEAKAPEPGGEATAKAALEITLLKERLAVAEQSPFERHGAEALTSYKGMRDSELRTSLMKLWCWSREAKELGLHAEVARITCVQIERLTKSLLELGAVAPQSVGRFDSLKQAIYNRIGVFIYESDYKDGKISLNYEAGRTCIKFACSPSNSVSLENSYHLVRCCVPIRSREFSGSTAKWFIPLRMIRNRSSHHSISELSYEGLINELADKEVFPYKFNGDKEKRRWKIDFIDMNTLWNRCQLLLAEMVKVAALDAITLQLFPDGEPDTVRHHRTSDVDKVKSRPKEQQSRITGNWVRPKSKFSASNSIGDIAGDLLGQIKFD